jgi:hypothetical protein
LIAFLIIRNRIFAEVSLYTKNALQLGDFAVEIKHLPKLENCPNADQLKAKLTLHIAKIVDNEDDVLDLNHENAAKDLAEEIEEN